MSAGTLPTLPDNALLGGSPARQNLMLACVVILAVLPVLFPPVIPLTDLAGHIGRYAVQLDGGQSAALAEWYSFRWYLIPNLGADLLVAAFAPTFGLEPTVKGIVALAVILQAAGILLLSRALHGRVVWTGLLALPLIYSNAFHFGFLNFALALGLGFCALAVWVRHNASTPRRWLLFLLVSGVIWICHLAGWAVFAIGAGSIELVRQWRRHRDPVRTFAATSIGLSCLVIPVVVGQVLSSAGTGSGETHGFFAWTEKLGYLIMMLRDRWQAIDIASMVILVSALFFVIRSPRVAIDPRLGLAAVLLAVAFLLLPLRLLGSFYADMRMIAPAMIFALVAARPTRQVSPGLLRVVTLAVGTFVTLRIAATAASLFLFGTQAERDMLVLESVPRNTMLASFRTVDCATQMWALDRSMHLAGYALARRHAFANDQWDVPGAQLLTIHNEAAGAYAKDPSMRVSVEPCGDAEPQLDAVFADLPIAFDLAWVNWTSEPRPIEGWRPAAQEGRSVLYRRSD